MEVTTTDCLVLGAGLAGSAYALHAARAGYRVDVLAAGGALEANSDWAQGGVIYDESPDPSLLRSDILAASDQTANPAAVEQLVQEGPSAVRELLLDELQVNFDRDATGDLDRAREGGHRERRIIHAKDSTGHAILSSLAALVDRTPRIQRHSGWVAIDLLTLSHSSTNPADRYEPLTCFGCYALDTSTGEVRAWLARKTILATGGLGGIFRHSTNQPGSVGSGVAMAYRVGARLIDLEYIQFHPTVLQMPGRAPFLITEALRGEGAVLVDVDGLRFMDDVHPLGSLAPRDVVSRTIKQHLAATGADRVFLDVSAIAPDFFRSRFPGIHAACRDRGIDPAQGRIPVVPAAHFSCGGVHADLEGRTTVRDLNAIGETACTGLHGANRLASTSLLECLVAARATAKSDVADLAQPASPWPKPKPWLSPSVAADPVLVRQDLELIQNTMWNYAGIIRSPRRLSRARRILLELREDIQAFYRDCRPTRELIQLRNAVQVALLVVHAASLNPVSKGCHFIAGDE
ncbi:MAG TPA: FAD-dependent oxidoreductase [Candidatus Didemnitutus sp.]|nr:FAD-dependent oxidoreductase [Candidatus Didemnitutus sp.]